MGCGIIDEMIALSAMNNYEMILDKARATAVKNRAMIIDWAKNEERVACPVSPVSGTTAFLRYDYPLDSYQFCLKLLNKTGVLVVPGEIYAEKGVFDRYFRLGYICNEEYLEKGLGKISKFLKTL